MSASHPLALIVYGAGLSDRLRLIEQLAASVPRGEQLAVMLTSPRLPAAESPAWQLPVAAVVATSVGCPCCVGAVAMQVTLVRLLRRSQPRRLFIELGDAGHVARAVATLIAGDLAGFVRLAGVLQAHHYGDAGPAVSRAPRLLQ
jgi:hypothetical protein